MWMKNQGKKTNISAYKYIFLGWVLRLSKMFPTLFKPRGTVHFIWSPAAIIYGETPDDMSASEHWDGFSSAFRFYLTSWSRQTSSFVVPISAEGAPSGRNPILCMYYVLLYSRKWNKKYECVCVCVIKWRIVRIIQRKSNAMTIFLMSLYKIMYLRLSNKTFNTKTSRTDFVINSESSTALSKQKWSNNS